MPENKIPSYILPVIVISQFTGTSLWFAGNAILSDLQLMWEVESHAIGTITSSVQLGFILGTLLFAFFAISDKYSPRKLFLACAIAGALFNLLIYLLASSFILVIILRFITGFFLAGIYPVGMKIAAGWFKKGLGNAIGLLVGALVLGTAFPHLLKSMGGSLPWQQVIVIVSGLATLGGVLMYTMVPDGPYIGKGASFNPRALRAIFKSPDFRAAAYGYFGHMWELYTLWAFIPFIITAYNSEHSSSLNTSTWSFIVIAAGSIGCILGGLISKIAGSGSVAFFQLLLSGLCCLLSPLLFNTPSTAFLIFLVFWGIVVAGDSPQFSAITARTAPQNLIGSGITIVVSLGFAITIFSIQLTEWIASLVPPAYIFLVLSAGPAFGLLKFSRLLKKKEY